MVVSSMLLGQNGWSRVHQTSFSSYFDVVRCFRQSQVSATAGNYWLNSVDQVLRCSTTSVFTFDAAKNAVRCPYHCTQLWSVKPTAISYANSVSQQDGSSPVAWTTATHCCTASTTRYFAACSLYRMLQHALVTGARRSDCHGVSQVTGPWPPHHTMLRQRHWL